VSELRVILDTDIGDDIDDAYALALLICSPEVRLEAVTVNTGDIAARAQLARRMLDEGGLHRVPVYQGLAGPGEARWPKQADWSRHHEPAGVIDQGAIAQLVRRAADAPGELTLVAIGPLTNLGAALDMDPEFGRRLRRLVLMGGSIVHGYDYGVVVPLDATNRLQVTARQMAQLALAGNPISRALVELTALSSFEHPTLHDPRTCAVLLDARLALGVRMRLEVTADGFTNLVPGEPNCTAVISPERTRFFDLLWQRYTAGSPHARQGG
jgi:inosine-uridine nucleoside N-ribohydrolase